MFIRQLEYLAALDREPHFGRAAAACHAAQPTLSAGIRGLERELGVPLVRRGRQFEGLTPEGRASSAGRERALADLESLQQEASRLRGGLEGMLRIGAIPTSLPLSPRVTARFRERHPRMRVRLTSMSSRQIAHGLKHGEIDAGSHTLDNEPLAHVHTIPLWREHSCSPHPPTARSVPPATVSWAAAADLPLCLLTPDMQHRRIVDRASPRRERSRALSWRPTPSRPSSRTRTRPARDHRPDVAGRQPPAR